VTDEAWNELCRALREELDCMADVRLHADEGAERMLAMDIPGIEEWAGHQELLLARLSRLAKRRGTALQACLPAAGALELTGMVGRQTLAVVLRMAPAAVAPILRELRDRLRQLRDEVGLVTARNEVLVRQALAFADELGRNLAGVVEPAAGYTAQGDAEDAEAARGELLALSL